MISPVYGGRFSSSWLVLLLTGDIASSNHKEESFGTSKQDSHAFLNAEKSDVTGLFS